MQGREPLMGLFFLFQLECVRIPFVLLHLCAIKRKFVYITEEYINSMLPKYYKKITIIVKKKHSANVRV